MTSDKSFDSAENKGKGGILDTILESEHAHDLADFNPEQLVAELFSTLRDRERDILRLRYGLSEKNQQTLEAIGKKLGLTRERVRQIEKESLASLRQRGSDEKVRKRLETIKKAITDHGGVFAEHALLDHLLVANKTERQVNALLFLLELFDDFKQLPETDHYHKAWHLEGFEVKHLDDFHREIKFHFESSGEPTDLETLKSAFKLSDSCKNHSPYFSDHVIENLLKITKHVKANPFGHFGLKHWRVIEPKDVGDKAYLVLKHHNKPEHYSKITEMINHHKFDDRVAYKETVHNELIMDPRFVLVGRGIYALKEWGYKKGVVADVIKEVLNEAEGPLERNKIIEEVMKRRMVKRNTILVGLANKKLFRKMGKNKYALV